MTIKHSLYCEEGTVAIDEERCTRCGACVRICPGEVLEMVEERVRLATHSPFGCIACGHCMMSCPVDAITVRGRGMAPEDLLPLPPTGERAGVEALAALMCSRRSIRRFQEREVDPGLVAQVVELAASAPMGIPPWDIGCVQVLGREEVRQVAGEVIKGYEGFLRFCTPWMLRLLRPFLGRAKYDMFADFIRPLAQNYTGAWQQGHDRLFYGAPALLLFHHSPYADALDASIACTYAMLAAESLGLGSTIIGGAPPILQRDRELCQRLGIPAGNKPSVALILGYPAVSFRKGIRRHFTQVHIIDGNRQDATPSPHSAS